MIFQKNIVANISMTILRFLFFFFFLSSRILININNYKDTNSYNLIKSLTVTYSCEVERVKEYTITVFIYFYTHAYARMYTYTLV